MELGAQRGRGFPGSRLSFPSIHQCGARARRRRRGHAMTNESHGRGLVEFHLPHHTKPTRVCHTNPAGGLPPPTAHRTAEQRLRAQALAGRYAPPEPAPAPSSRLADGWRTGRSSVGWKNFRNSPWKPACRASSRQRRRHPAGHARAQEKADWFTALL